MAVPKKSFYDVIIVGGGPVGLYLSISLRQHNISCIVLEKRSEPRSGSRSLGIHPVSLELFNELGLADRLVQNGIKIYRGLAFFNTEKIGEISFEDCPPPFNFILSLPQYHTEQILNNYITTHFDNLLFRECEVTDIQQMDDRVTVSFQKMGVTHSISGAFLVGCDGKQSKTRRQINSSFKGKAYPDAYIMGDFSDNTSLGNQAAVYLCDDGLIESFPISGGKRRWVVKTGDYMSHLCREDIESRVHLRIGHELDDTDNYMLSSFGVQKYLANPMVKHRVVLAGDAAHIVSPIGGQGMNLGWLGARDLTDTLAEILHEKDQVSAALNRFEERRVKAARNAVRRAELNMRLGRKSSFPLVKKQILYLMTHTPLSNIMARLFTMRGIERWIT